MVTGHVRPRYVPSETRFLNEVTGASPKPKRAWKFWPSRKNASNKRFRYNAFPATDLGLFIGRFVRHLDGPFRGLPGTRFSA